MTSRFAMKRLKQYLEPAPKGLKQGLPLRLYTTVGLGVRPEDNVFETELTVRCHKDRTADDESEGNLTGR